MRFGDFELDFLSDGTFKLDGGTMFGIVPKVLWSRACPADERNRVEISCNCPLIRTGKRTILIDCGLGQKWNARQRDIYAIGDRPRLLEELGRVGVRPEDITDIIHTHLHLDHAGWNTKLNAAGVPEPVFVNARHVVERRELDVARKPNELQRGTYLAENIAPIDAQKSWDVFDEVRQVVPGVTAFRTGGHTAGHAAVWIESGAQRTLFISEILPTRAHRHLPWVMSYDLFPLEMLELKRRLLKECVEQNVLVLLNHDPDAFAVRLKEAERGNIEVIKEV